MDKEKILETHSELIESIPLSPEDFKRIDKKFCDSAKPEHERKYIGEGFNDQYVCSCGWESPPYWDGEEYARDKWYNHILEVSK